MEKKEIILRRIIFSIFLLSVPLVVGENIIYGDPLPEGERLSSLSITSDIFNYENTSYIYVKALNTDNEMINLDAITIKPQNLTEYSDYKSTALSQNLNKQYKQGFTVENESIQEITFKITAIKGDKTITQNYVVEISENEKKSNFQEKTIASINFLWDGIANNTGAILIGMLVFFMIIFIIKGFNYLTK